MPEADSSAPRKKLPPPTTIATSTCPTVAAICLAIPRTVSGSTPSLPPPKTSPDSLSRTRRRLGATAAGMVRSISFWVSMVPPGRGIGIRSRIEGAGRSHAGARTGAGIAADQGRKKGRPPMVATPSSGTVAGSVIRWRTDSGSDAETCEPGGLHAGGFEHLADRLLRVLGERLVQQHDLLEEAGQAAFDDL